ncbi:hypothetical protein HDV62DRAFT_373637 [Trichoderma sp. SZMC 28011]
MRPPWPPVVSSLPWMVCRGVAPKGLEASPPAVLGRCSLPPETCVAWEKRIEVQDGDSPGLCFF